MVITNNMRAENAQRQYMVNAENLEKTDEKLSSGYRINRSADDAAGLKISEKMRQQIRGLDKGGNNIQDGIALLQVADGALSQVHDILQRMNELAVQAANDINTAIDRDAIQQEVNALTSEITRIGKETEFNRFHILDVVYRPGSSSVSGGIASLVTSPAAGTGYLKEAYQASNGKWYSSASLDFAGVNPSNMSQLNNKGFAFYCSQSCGEIFDIKFATDGTPSSGTNLSGSVRHKYVVDISNCQNGTDIVNTVYNYIASNPVSGNSGSSAVGGLYVSHSNNLIKDGSKLIVAENWKPYNTETEAKQAYPRSYANSGKIDAEQLIRKSTPSRINMFYIKCSSNPVSYQMIYTYETNSKLLGVDELSYLDSDGASNAIQAVSKAIEKVSTQRSEMGAYQNRLEHSYINNLSMHENTQYAESRIRDADMAEEMVKHSKHSIIARAGEAIMAQANESNRDALSLLL